MARTQFTRFKGVARSIIRLTNEGAITFFVEISTQTRWALDPGHLPGDPALTRGKSEGMASEQPRGLLLTREDPGKVTEREPRLSC